MTGKITKKIQKKNKAKMWYKGTKDEHVVMRGDGFPLRLSP